MNSTDLNRSDNSDYILIVENIGENLKVKSKETNNTILEGVCAVFGQKNNNQRVYEKDEYLPHLEYLKEKIEARQLVGELDHPPSFEITLKSASHIVEGLEHDGGDKVNIKVRILENTPNGKVAKALIDGGVNISISSRAAGQVLNEGKVKLHRIFTYDLVAEPGFTEAVLKKTVNESLQNNFELLTESFNSLKENSYINKNNLNEVSEKLNFANNYKVYKINNKNTPELSKSLGNQKNSNTMGEYVTRNDMNHYSEIVKKQFESIQKDMKELTKVEVQEENNDVPVTTDVNEKESVGTYVNYLAEQIENLAKYTDYVASKLNQTIKYGEHVAETTNNGIEYQNYLAEKVNQNINYSNYIAEGLNKGINYTEYLKENLNKSINYQSYLAEELDKGIQYTEYVAEGSNRGIEYTEHVAGNANLNREYAEHIAEKASKGIGYSEYIAESLNSGKFKPNKGLLDGVEKLDESSQINAIAQSVDNVIQTVKDNSTSAVLENKYPFLKVLSDNNKDSFYKLDTETKQAIIEALGASVWFNENDVTSIMTAVVEQKNKHIPAHIKFMPNEYKATWDNMNENEKNNVHTKAQLYTLNTPYQVKAFWDEMNLNGISERVAVEKENLKLQKLNESQSTEGAIPVNRVVEMSRGYSKGYINSLMRGAESRK